MKYINSFKDFQQKKWEKLKLLSKLAKYLSKKSKFVYQILFVDMSRRTMSSRPEVFCKNAIVKNFAEFTGKHLCKSLFQFY